MNELSKKTYSRPLSICHTKLDMSNEMMITLSRKNYEQTTWEVTDDDVGISSGHSDYAASDWGNISNDGISSGHQSYESSAWGE